MISLNLNTPFCFSGRRSRQPAKHLQIIGGPARQATSEDWFIKMQPTIQQGAQYIRQHVRAGLPVDEKMLYGIAASAYGSHFYANRLNVPGAIDVNDFSGEVTLKGGVHSINVGRTRPVTKDWLADMRSAGRFLLEQQCQRFKGDEAIYYGALGSLKPTAEEKHGTEIGLGYKDQPWVKWLPLSGVTSKTKGVREDGLVHCGVIEPNKGFSIAAPTASQKAIRQFRRGGVQRLITAAKTGGATEYQAAEADVLFADAVMQDCYRGSSGISNVVLAMFRKAFGVDFKGYKQGQQPYAWACFASPDHFKGELYPKLLKRPLAFTNATEQFRYRLKAKN